MEERLKRVAELKHSVKLHDKKIFFLGCGAVGQCVLPLLFHIVDLPHKNVTVMDFRDKHQVLKPYIEKGLTFIQDRLTEENYEKLLDTHLKEGDVFMDLSWDVDTVDMIDYCHRKKVLYVNTSVEVWHPYSEENQADPLNQTLYTRHMNLRKKMDTWKENKESWTSAVLDHGANPGLVSHFIKQALIEIANTVAGNCGEGQEEHKKKLLELVKSGNFAKLAQAIGLKVVHVSERDSQLTNQPKQVNEFVNTWSIPGFIEEAFAPAELGWGTHEKKMPTGAQGYEDGPQNQIALATRGMGTRVRSWVPSGPIFGYVIRHGEAFGISDRLTVRNEKGVAEYRPTVHYAYCPCDSGLASLYEVQMRDFEPQEKQRILQDDIIGGKDELGCLLMGDFGSWWIGSLLDIVEARRIVEHQNATTVQVAISLVAVFTWIIENPTKGVCLPDDIDYKHILKVAVPFLGPFVSQKTNWTPYGLKNTVFENDRRFIFPRNAKSVKGKNTKHCEVDPTDEYAWQFEDFLVL